MNDSEPIENYSNGPLPSPLKERAYFTSEESEFALRQSDALAYLDWCEAKGIAVWATKFGMRQFPARQFQSAG